MHIKEYLKAPVGMRNPAAEGRPLSDPDKALEAYKEDITAQCITPGLFVF